MTQPKPRRFVMESRLDAEVEQINYALDLKVDLTDPRLTDERVPLDNSVTSAKIANGTIVEADLADGAVTSAKIANGTITEADLAALDYVKFDTTYSGGSTQPGMINWNDTDGTLEFQLKGGNVTLQVGQEQVVRVKNNTGSTLLNGKAVYISGSDGSNLRVAYANAGAENTSAGTIGVLAEDLNNGNAGYVTTFGLVRAIDTSTLTEGAPVWLATTNGGLTATRPTAPNHGVMVGFCLRAHATQGVIFVRVDNGWELDELHNVLITSPTNGQALTYESATGLWKNATPASTLTDLTDVTITSPAAGEKLVYNGTQWVNLASAGSAFTVSDTAPSLSTASEGDAWLNSSTGTGGGTMFVCYVDPTGTKLWMQVQANSALEASILSRLGALESQTVAFGALSPNYIINGAFEINQRAFSSTTSSGFTFDRWAAFYASGSVTFSNQVFSPGASPSATVTGKNYLRCVTTGQSGSSAYAIISQAIEGVETLAGETVTVSFWAKAASGTPKVALEMYRSYGAGGSPSADEQLYAGQVTLSTSMQRYSITYTLPSISGKTLGTTHTGYVKPQFWLSAGTDFNARTGSLGIQSNTFDIWGVQVERGSTATSFRRNANSIAGELAACQRYYKRWTAFDAGYIIIGAGTTVNTSVCQFDIHNQMRVGPSSIEVSNAQIFRLAGIAVTATASICAPTPTNTVVRFTGPGGSFTSTPENVIIYATSAGGYIALSAEL